MKALFTFTLLLAAAGTFAQPVPAPLEEQHHINYWWWVLGVVLVLVIGAWLYTLIKKDPRRDAQ